MAEDLVKQNLSEVLAALATDVPLRAGATKLLNVLGYASDRTEHVGAVGEFLERFKPEKPFSRTQLALFDSWSAVDIVFQFTANEIAREPSLFDRSGFDEGRIESFLFLAVELQPGTYSRGQLADVTRAVNRLFAMPVIVLFRHGCALSLAAVHRRPSQKDGDKDVLDKVTLVKDIQLESPHRAHVEILAELAFSEMITAGVQTFDDLHLKWEQTLDVEVLNRRFYRELFGWFERATSECTFPDDGAGPGCVERHVIRLITRLLFIWFLKEKDLVPEELFEDEFARSTLKEHADNRTDYYRAVLQNLFFATLNSEIEQRSFRKPGEPVHGELNLYRYHDLLADPAAFVERLGKVPFVNGGLFDCLDGFADTSADNGLVDAFTDDVAHADDLGVPACLFFDENGLFQLFRHYKFTVEESTPLDREVALDPELLGRVFENLLAAYNPETRATARKATGSYYTPRPVVDYMVREALTEALAIRVPPTATASEHWRDQLGYLLDWEHSHADAGQYFEPDEARSVVVAIADLKTLDPAVGSGAFPMGVLQTLTLALRRLDPDNTLWEEIQKERAKERAAEAFDTQDQVSRDEALRDISAIFEKYRQSDFGRKLYLIQNGIYGVDIQPIACQIAKLRFFISLVIEQTPDPATPNLGVKPLPNLETQLVAADTLLGLGRPAQMELGRSAPVQEIERELLVNRERHFHAGDQATKLEIQTNDGRLRARLAERLRQAGFAATAAERIASWDPYDQNAVARWFDPEYIFGISNGFDIVIGNPPYIQLQKNGGEAGNRYRPEGYETFQRTGDIYQLFYERGCELLKCDTGVLGYITSNSWLKAEYGRPLRRWFSERHMPLKLIEMGKDVFENAIVDTAVLLVRNGKASPVTCSAVDVERGSTKRFPPHSAEWGTLQPAGDRPWMALLPAERNILEKMEAVGKPLKDWDISIYYGIKTGYNKAFIVNDRVRDQLIAEDPASERLLKPVLRGRDIARYRAKWAGHWLVDTHNGYASVPPVRVEDYPAIKAHLDKFLPCLERRQDKGRTPYNLRNCAYHESFTQEKLFWMDLTPEGRFSYVPASKEMYCANTVYFMHGSRMKFLAAFLNSSLITWYVNQTTVTSGMGTARWFAVTVENIPIPPFLENGSKLEALVDHLIVAMRDGATKQIEELELAIEQSVFQAYGVTEAERLALGKPNRIQSI